MEPITTILTALIAGAAAGATQVASQTIGDAYAGLKALVTSKLGGQAGVGDAIQRVEGDPQSKGRQMVLQEELDKAAAADPAAIQDPELLATARELLALLEQAGQPTAGTVQVTVSGSGAAAVGPGAKAAGERGVVADNISGPVSTGDNTRHISTPNYTERTIDTGGGSYTEGNVDTGGGDFVGRDKRGS